MKVFQHLRMDLARCGCAPVVSAVQGDANTRTLVVSLYDNGIAWEIPETSVVDVAYKKPDGTQGIYSKLPDGSVATSFSDNVLTAVLAPQVLTCPGKVTAAFVFYKDGEQTLATFPFTITVTANPAAGAERSEDYFNPEDLSDLRAEIAAHTTRHDNPHGVTAEQVGARPNTWMPTASDVGARANTWLPSLTEIGAAPAGFGLGENVPVDIDHLDLANRIGWFRSNEGMESLGLTPGWWFGNYLPYGDNDGVWELNHYLDGLKANIRKVNGVLQPAEWVNPPMFAGEEYRTTERYGGKPVYVRAVDCGNIPNATHKTITYGEENCMAIFVYGTTNYVGTVPSMNVGAAMGLGFNSDQVISLWGNRNTISIACGGDRSSASLVCVVKYYKTTD